MAEKDSTTMGTPVDSEAVITVLPNYSASYVVLYPPQNDGKEMTYDRLISELALKGVKHNVNTELLRSMIENREYDKEIKAASADMPENGVDGTITYKFDKETVLAPKEDERGFVDYKDLGLIRNIRENEVIAEITLPTEGTNGRDVRGVEMRAVPGKPARFSVGKGTKLSDDGLKIYAACDGHVCYRDQAFCVDETVTIGDVDASVGNLDFIGDIVIKGEVMEGFTINAGKDIAIAGNVTGATVKAGGKITIKKGSINSTLTSHGDITCQFCENSRISTDGNVYAQNFFICDVYCAGDLSAKSLSGGKYTVLGNTEVTYLGTKAYAATEVTAGDNAVLKKEKDECEKRIEDLDGKILRCNQIIDFLTEKRKELKALPQDKEELLGSTIKTKFTCQNEKKQLKKRIITIEESLQRRQLCHVTVKGMAYPGSKVIINEETRKFETETPRVKIFIDENGLMVEGTP